jgi:hypothetical protein
VVSRRPDGPARVEPDALGSDERGAVVVEYVVAFAATAAMFGAFISLVQFEMAELMLQRAAGIAARSCAVLKNQPRHCDDNAKVTGQNPEEDTWVLQAAQDALYPYNPDEFTIDRDLSTIKTDASDRLSGKDTVSLVGHLSCKNPPLSWIFGPLCTPLAAAQGRFVTLRASADYAHQGARYDCWYAGALTLPNGATLDLTAL